MKKIVIVGNGAAGLFCAAAIKRNLPQFDVSVVYDPDKRHIGVGESLSFNGPDFFRSVLGLTNEYDWMRDSGSAYKFGTQHLGFDGNDDKPFYILSPLNTSYKVLHRSALEHFYQYYNHSDQWSMYDVWAWAKKHNLTNLQFPQQGLGEGYWFMQHNTCPINEDGSWMISPYMGHSYHINAESIRLTVHNKVGVPAGVKEIPIPIREVVAENGNVKHLVLENEEIVTADLFIDCTGFSKLLIDLLPFEFDQCHEYFNNASLVGNYKYQDPEEHNAHTTLAAMDHGWRFSISMNGRSGEGYQFNRNIFDREDDLIAEYERKTGRPGNILRKITWTPGFYKQAFVGNTIALGLSGGFVDVFDANNFSSTLMFIKRLVSLLGDDPTLNCDWRSSFNWYVNEINSDIKFRIESAFHLAPKNNSEYWHAMKEAGVKYNTLERFQAALFSTRKKHNLSFQNNAYSQHIFMNTAVYYNIPIPVPDFNVDPVTIELANEYFKFISNKGYIQSKHAQSMGKFYTTVLHTNRDMPEFELDPSIIMYEDFLG